LEGYRNFQKNVPWEESGDVPRPAFASPIVPCPLSLSSHRGTRY
jgi:hypothetical protein